MSGGSGSDFTSIPVRNLRSLLLAIRLDFDKWIQDTNPSYVCRYPGDPLSNKKVLWDSFSEPIQYFFKTKKLNPCEEYDLFYSSQRHTVAVSYVWSATDLSRIADEFEKPEYDCERVFIDVLCVPQSNVQTEEVVRTTKLTYSKCWLVIFVTNSYLRRAWCALEVAVGTSTGCQLTILGSCDVIKGKRFYEHLEATFTNDVDLIKKEIINIFKDKDAFNEVVASAMQVLFVVAQKNKEFEALEMPREKRAEWISRMPSTNPKLLDRDREKDWAAMTGKISSLNLDVTPRAMRVFLSSTFSDTLLEWRFFLQDVLPFLKICARNRGLDFDVSDMRFGNKQEESLPLDIRLAELERCRDESADIFYMLLLGNMHGPRSAPLRIPQLELESLLQFMEPAESACVSERYRLDENQLDAECEPSPEYILLESATQYESKQFSLEEALHNAALKCWPDASASVQHDLRSVHPSTSYVASAMEKEIRRALILAGEQSERLCVFQRIFHQESLDQSSPVACMYLDTPQANQGMASPQANLFSSISRSVLPCCLHVPGYSGSQSRHGISLKGLFSEMTPENGKPHRTAMHEYKVDFRSGIDLSDGHHRQYLTRFLDDSCKVLLDAMDRTEARLATSPCRLVDEITQHLAFASLRAKRFTPTASSSAALDRVKQWMRDSGGKTYVLHGPSGAGKTYVVSKLVVDLSSENTVCVVRFLGTSGDSGDISGLLRSICHQLRIILMGREAFFPNADSFTESGSCPVTDDALMNDFHNLIQKWGLNEDLGPLVLILDSLDQLKDTHFGRKLDWLPVEGYSAKVRIVCSTLPDEVGWPFRCLSILTSRIRDRERFAEVSALKDSAHLIEHLLKLKHRRVNEIQLAALVEVDKARTPLMATLIADRARLWTSSTLIPEYLPDSVHGIIFEYFDGLASHFDNVMQTAKQVSAHSTEHALSSITQGTCLVKHAISYITLVNKGISDTELQEILSLDDDVLAYSHQWWFTPDRKVPSAPLQLLLRLLAPYLSWRGQRIGGALSFWYHRQLWEAAEAHFLKDQEFRASCHRVLAEFFSGRFSTIHKPCSKNLRIRLGLSNDDAQAGVNRHVRDQPLVIKGKSAFHSNAIINERRCTGAMHHMVMELEILKNIIGLRERFLECAKLAEEEVCSAEGVCARGLSGETFNLVRQSETLLRLMSEVGMDPVSADHFNRWIRRDAHEFVSALSVWLSALCLPVSSKARGQFLSSTRQHVPGFPWLVLGGSNEFDAIASILKGHKRTVNCADWHGNRLVSGDNDGLMIIWDALTGKKLAEVEDQKHPVHSVKWSPNGDRILSVSLVGSEPGSRSSSCIIWDADSGVKVSVLIGHSDWIRSVAWRGDKIVSGSDDKKLIIWKAVSPLGSVTHPLSQLEGHSASVWSVAWCPKGEQIVSGGSNPSDNSWDPGEMFLWDAATGQKIALHNGHSGAVTSVSWSPKGDLIISGSCDYTCIIWDAITRGVRSKLIGHANWVNSVAWNMTGDKVLSGSSDSTGIIWDVLTGEVVLKLEGHNDWVRCVAWSPKGDQVLSSSSDRTCIIWDAATGSRISNLNGHSREVSGVAWSPEGGRILSGSRDKTLIVWDAATGLKVSQLKGHSQMVTSVSWSPGGDRVLSGSRDNTCIIWDAATGERVSTLQGHTGWVDSVAWSPKGDRAISGSSDRTCAVWDATTGGRILPLTGHSAGVRTVAWSPAGDRIASGSNDKTVIVWDAVKGDRLWQLEGHRSEVLSVGWNPAANQIVSGGNDSTAFIWDVASGSRISELRGHSDWVRCVAWSHDGRQIATGGSDNTVLVWDTATGGLVSRLRGHADLVTGVAWRAADNRLVSGSNDKRVIVWGEIVDNQAR